MLFTGWVLSLFTGLILADIPAVRWSARTRARLRAVMQAVTATQVFAAVTLLLRPGYARPSCCSSST